MALHPCGYHIETGSITIEAIHELRIRLLENLLCLNTED